MKNDIIMPTAIDFLYDMFNVLLQFIRGTWKDHLRILNLEWHDISVTAADRTHCRGFAPQCSQQHMNTLRLRAAHICVPKECFKRKTLKRKHVTC